MNVDKQALRDEVQEWKDIYCEPADAENLQFFLGVEALLDELEAKDKQIADLKEAFRIALSAAGIDAPAAAGKGEAS